MYNAKYAALFKNAPPIDFSIGYRWRTPKSNVLLSVRLPDDGSAGADATSSTETAPPRHTAAPAKAATAGGCRTAAARRWLLLLAMRAESQPRHRLRVISR